jgi:RNA recognition motif-containing protein
MAQKLYVGNLPFSVTEDDLRELFAAHGTVHSINLIADRDTGRPRGFAFVEMDGAEAATEALNGHEIDGRALKVSEAKERQPRTGGGGGGGGGRGGGGGGGGGGGRDRW